MTLTATDVGDSAARPRRPHHAARRARRECGSLRSIRVGSRPGPSGSRGMARTSRSVSRTRPAGRWRGSVRRIPARQAANPQRGVHSGVVRGLRWLEHRPVAASGIRARRSRSRRSDRNRTCPGTGSCSDRRAGRAPTVGSGQRAPPDPGRETGFDPRAYRSSSSSEPGARAARPLRSRKGVRSAGIERKQTGQCRRDGRHGVSSSLRSRFGSGLDGAPRFRP